MHEFELSEAAHRVLETADDGEFSASDLCRALEDGEALAKWGFTDDDTPAIDEAYNFLESWEDIANLMDDEIREAIHSELAPCSHLAFIDEYCKRHEEKFGEPFRFN